ncbi:MAG: penicillin-binding protein 2 [Rhodospirillaceae bacterium]|nr:penicillin-binding protein 2 [Rhodospirillaceae bacterium]
MSITRDSDWTKMFNRRAAILAGGKAALIATLIGRMYYLQVVQSDRYKTLAEDNRINIQLLPPPRGRILDRFGQPLALNKQQFRVLVIPEQAMKVSTTLDALAQLMDLGEHERERIKKEVGRKRSFVPITIKENLSWDEMARIQVNAPDLPGIVIDEGLTRYYPHGQLAAHLLGYVSSVDEADLTGDPLLQLPGFRIGKDGVEKVYDLQLRGKGGTSQVEVNAYGRAIRELERDEGEAGADVVLTIDERIQSFAGQRLGEDSASVVVMDVHTGDLLAMVSNPSFDSNAFSRGLTTDEWKGLVNNDHKPLLNKVVSATYSPGSTFKLVVTLAALEHNVISPEATCFCNGRDPKIPQFQCHKTHGHVNMVRAISTSCDIYFYEVARRLGPDKIAAMAKQLGLGQISGIGLPGEKVGLIPTEAWKKAARGERWTTGETMNTGIGQGYVSITPIQLATMVSRVANGALAVKPRLVRPGVVAAQNGTIQPEDGAGAAYESLNIPMEHISILKQGMFDVVNGPDGATTARTGGKLRTKDPNGNLWLLSGKTGTAQVRSLSDAERAMYKDKPELIPWKLRDNAFFVCFAPSDAPRYAIAVVVDHALGGGGAFAAPIARDIMEEVLRLDPSRKPRVEGDQIAAVTEQPT